MWVIVQETWICRSTQGTALLKSLGGHTIFDLAWHSELIDLISVCDCQAGYLVLAFSIEILNVISVFLYLVLVSECRSGVQTTPHANIWRRSPRPGWPATLLN
jgi:hypothetical protein